MSDDHARHVMAMKLRHANAVAAQLLHLYRTGEAYRAGVVVKELFDVGDADLVLFVIGHLCGAAVIAERSASTAHGPLMTAAQQGIEVASKEDNPWIVSVADQMAAAAEQGDSDTLCQLGVDGLIRATTFDWPHGPVPLELTLRYALQLDQSVLALVTAEAIRRLANEGRRDE